MKLLVALLLLPLQALALSITLQDPFAVTDCGDGTFKRECPSGGGSEGTIYTLSWEQPTLTTAGASLTTQVTGYKIYDCGADAATACVEEGAITDRTDTDWSTDTASRVCIAATWNDGVTTSQTPLNCLDTRLLYNAADCDDTLLSTDTKTTFQSELDALSAGDRYCIRAGTYEFWEDNAVTVDVDNDGTSGSRIYISAYPGDARPTLRGGGSLSLWQSAEASDSGPPQANINSQVCMNIDGDYVTWQDIDMDFCEHSNMSVTGSNVEIVNSSFGHTWSEISNLEIGFYLGTSGRNTSMSNLSLDYVECYYGRHGNGCGHRITGSPGASNTITDGTYNHLLAWGNGKLSETQATPWDNVPSNSSENDPDGGATLMAWRVSSTWYTRKTATFLRVNRC